MAAFSNRAEATVRSLLGHTGVLPLLDLVVSVDDLKTFKPDPRVYAYLAERLGATGLGDVARVEQSLGRD